MSNDIKSKATIFKIITALLLIFIILPSSMTGYIFGQEYISDKDYTCCKDNKLIVYHYYKRHFFGVFINSGYKTDTSKIVMKEGCNVQCND